MEKVNRRMMFKTIPASVMAMSCEVKGFSIGTVTERNLSDSKNNLPVKNFIDELEQYLNTLPKEENAIFNNHRLFKDKVVILADKYNLLDIKSMLLYNPSPVSYNGWYNIIEATDHDNMMPVVGIRVFPYMPKIHPHPDNKKDGYQLKISLV